MSLRPVAPVLLGALACVALAALLAGRELERPGLYYDEVIQAVPAREFLREEGRPSQIPGMREVRWLGGWFPVQTQPYMGALKSQVLIPVFAVFDASTRSLRLATLGIGLLGMLAAMAFARRALGAPAALLTGLLLAVDPSFLFVSRHDWGSFALSLLLRCSALYFLFTGFDGRSALRLAVGGLCVGLGGYNKVDFGVGALAAAGALLCVRPDLPVALWRRRSETAAALAGLAVGSAPILASLSDTFRAARKAAGHLQLDSPDWPEKLFAARATLDGSYFDLLMRAGGSFERMLGSDPAAASLLPLLFVASGAALTFLLLREARRGPWNRVHGFLLLTAILTPLAILLTPRATRIHHWLNLYPFPHLVVSAAAVALWRRAEGAWAGRVALAAALGVAFATAVRVDVVTLRGIREGGGKGRWSDAVAALSAELAERPGSVAVSLDWGFDAPLRFLDAQLATREPFWGLRGRRSLALPPGAAGHVYLVAEPDYAVFPYGAALLRALDRLPEGSVAVRRHRDREGDPAFRSVRFRGPHRLVYRDGRFEVEWLR